MAAGAASRCVQCLFDTDCDVPLICDAVAKACVECVPGRADACRPDLAGAQCLAGGKCGCTQDSDCGSLTSGHVCETSAQRCIPGCRGTGGNICPIAQICSSTTDEIGRCGTKPATDGGTTDGGATDGGATDGDAADDSATDASPVDVGVADDGATDAGAAEGGAADAPTGRDGLPSDAPSADRGVSADAASDASDVGVQLAGNGAYLAGGGCACSAGSDGPRHPANLLLVVLALAMLGRVRRRRR